MSNLFTITVTSTGFVEVLTYKGRTYTKEYIKTEEGWRGKQKSWEYETALPVELVEALEERDPGDIMDALETY